MRCSFLAMGLVAMALSSSVASSVARAADPNNVKEADRRFHEGVRLMAAGKADEARVRFAEANALVRSTDILWNLIAAEVQSAHYADALNHAHQFVRDPKAPASEVADTNGKTIPIATKWVGQIEVEAPAGAQIEIDSKEKAGHAPLLDAYAVLPGAHQVVAITSDDRITKDVEVTAGQTVHVVLGAKLPPPAVVTVSDAPQSVQPAVSAPAPAPPTPTDRPLSGEHPVEHGGDGDTRVKLTIGFAAGAVLLGAGSIAFLAMADSAKSSASRLQSSLAPGSCPGANGCSDLSDDLHSQNTDFRVGEVLMVGAVAAAGGAALSWFLLRPHERAHGARAFVVAPAVGPARAGLLLQGAF